MGESEPTKQFTIRVPLSEIEELRRINSHITGKDESKTAPYTLLQRAVNHFIQCKNISILSILSEIDNDPILTPDEAAELLECSRFTIIQMIKSGEIMATVKRKNKKKPRYLIPSLEIERIRDEQKRAMTRPTVVNMGS